MLVGLIDVDDVDHVDAVGSEHFFDLVVEFASGQVPGDREIVERVAEDQVVLFGILVQLDELAGVAPISLDRRILGKPGGPPVGLVTALSISATSTPVPG